MKAGVTLLLYLVTQLGEAGGSAAQVTVFAASSLSESLREIASVYEKGRRDKLRFNLAASSTLARQIEAGAKADLFFAADEAQMNRLERKQLIIKATRRDLLGNSLVIVVPKTSNTTINAPADLTRPEVKRVALGNPVAVPVGVYAKSYFEARGLWGAIAPKVVPCESARSALAVVATGNAEAAVVYKTDAMSSRKVAIAVEIPAEETPRIVYPVALVNGKQSQAAAEFFSFLFSESAGRIFERHGFKLISPLAK